MFGIIRLAGIGLAGNSGRRGKRTCAGCACRYATITGRPARLATNYDGLIVSVLAEAQADGAPERRAAGRCALRRMRRADVAIGDCARLAASVSLVLAAAKMRDHATGSPAGSGYAAATDMLAGRWAAAGARTGGELGFEFGVLTEAVGRQTAVESAAGPGTPLIAITEPTETATAAAFGYTAVLAGKPGNQAALAEAGRLFGRVAHLLDAVEDLAADRESGAWNPLLATGADAAGAPRLCDDALLGIRLALAEAEFTDSRLVTALLVDELGRSVRRTFTHAAGAGVAGAASASARPWLRRRRFGCCECDCCCDCNC